ncbi:MAG TPA: DUF1080 domain-containing protein [Candidatus Acidoferrum sp.]|nr:DUF1080 domain-containing protein [Candidatus Acidoferrum sp.]
MKMRHVVFALAVAVLSVGPRAVARARGYENAPAAPAGESAKAFLGRWDLTLKDGSHEYPSWLELSQEGSHLVAQFVGRWGNARPLPKAELSNGKLTFVSPKEEEGAQADLIFEGTLAGKDLSGTVNGPDGKRWQWTGERAQALARTKPPKWGKPIELFNKKDLAGWHVSDPNAEKVWRVENGELITPGNGPELINDGTYEDFKLHVEFNCGENANSGVYLRGRYEVQIETDSIEEPPSHHMGGVYGFLTPTPELPRKPGTWQTYDITLVGRMVTVVQNGQTIIDNKEIPGITGGALDSHEGLPGPIYLQGSEKGRVTFRSIVLTPAEK